MKRFTLIVLCATLACARAHTDPALVRPRIDPVLRNQLQCGGAVLSSEWQHHRFEKPSIEDGVCVILGRFGQPSRLAAEFQGPIVHTMTLYWELPRPLSARLEFYPANAVNRQEHPGATGRWLLVAVNAG